MATVAPLPPGSPPTASSPMPGQTQGQVISAPGPNTRAPPITQHTTPIPGPALPSQNQQSPLPRPGHTIGANGATVPSAATGSPASTNTPISAPSVATAVTPPLDPYRDPEPLMECRERPIINKYPHAPLSAGHLERASQVLNAFRHAIINSKVKKKFRLTYLRDFNSLITFEVYMCGPSAAQSKPSILAFCPEKICPLLRMQLQVNNLRYQYAAGVTPGPSFELHYCLREVPYVRTWCENAVRLSSSTDQDVSEGLGNPSNALTMCGTRVHLVQNGQDTPPGFAALACLLEIKGDLFCLTSAHPFRNGDDVSSQEKLIEQLQEISDDNDDVEECEIIFDDEEDGDLSFDSNGCDGDSVKGTKHFPTGKLLPGEANVNEPSSRLQDLEESTAIFPGPGDLGSDESDRDWAVTPIRRAGQRLPNAYSVDQNSFRLRYLTEIACEHPTEIKQSTKDKQPTIDTSVHILTSSSIKCGTLIPGFANLAGLSGRGSCKVWIVSMKGSTPIVKGDSGSLVVDASTFRVYGHVVATSPLGDVYLVPLHDTLQQIKAFFETTDVRLPDPLRLLTEVALFYLEAEQPKLAKTAIIALSDLVQQMCDARKWRQLSHWAVTSASRSTLLIRPDDELAEVFPEFKDRLHVIREPLMVKHILRQRLLAERSRVDSCSLQSQWEALYSFFYALLPQTILEERYLPDFTVFPYSFALNHLRHHGGQTDLTIQSAGLFHACHSLLTNPFCGRFAWEARSLRGSGTLRSQPRFLPCLSPEITTCSVDTRFSLCSDLHADCKSPGPSLYKDLLRSSERLADGGFATVYRVMIPETHRAKWSTNGETQIALKMISKRTTPFTQWLNEKRILKQLQKFNHPNIIKLLDSFCAEDNYLLLFPLATCDLDSLMTFNPPASQKLFIWALEQMRGLAEALEHLHTGNERNKCYGRHGDLKPENILFFNQDKSFNLGNEPTSGILVIADFGLSEFNSKTSTSSCPTKAVDSDYPPRYRSRADRQYAPPEVEVPMNARSANRAYDIWSFGCIFLELFVWIVAGAESRRQLLKELHSNAPGHPASYWRIEMRTQSLAFSLKPQVSTWLELLLERTKNNAMLRAAIDLLIYGGLLDPDPDIRPTAKELGRMLVEIETGTAAERRNTTDTLPVWKRFWIRQNVHSHWPGSPLLHLEVPVDKDGDIASTTTATMPPERKEEESQSSESSSDSPDKYGEEPPLKQKCPYCENIGRPIAIKYHVRSQHRNRHPQECPRCGYLFMDNKQLSRYRQGLNLHTSCAISPAAPIAEDPEKKNTLQQLPLILPPALSIDKDKPATEDSGRESDQPARSGSYSFSRSLTDNFTPGAGPTKMRSGGVKRYHPDDDLSRGSIVK